MIRNTGLLLLALTLVAGSASAGMTPGSGALFVNLNYALGKLADTGESVDGGFVVVEYQKMDWSNPVSFGFSVGYGEINDVAAADSSRANYSFSSIPVYLGGKYWLGEEKIQGFIGVMFGMYFSQLTRSISYEYEGLDDGSYTSETATNFGLGFPVGVSVSISDKMMLNASYTLNWLWDNPFLDNDLLHAFGVGVGFSFGP